MSELLLPRYQCHKVVRAAKILAVEHGGDGPRLVLEIPGAGPGVTWPLTMHFIHRHDPKAGGYLVQYEDGYTSYSPAEPFESGYTRLDPAILPEEPTVVPPVDETPREPRPVPMAANDEIPPSLVPVEGEPDAQPADVDTE